MQLHSAYKVHWYETYSVYERDALHEHYGKVSCISNINQLWEHHNSNIKELSKNILQVSAVTLFKIFYTSSLAACFLQLPGYDTF